MHLYEFDEELKHHGVLGMKWGVRKDRQTSSRPPLKKGDVVLSKGTKLQRIATGANMSYTQGVYLSYKAGDKDIYRGILGRMRVSWLINNEPGEVQLKQLTFTANKEIRIPNKQTRIDELKNLIRTDRDGVIALINEHETTTRRSKGYESNKITDKSVNETMYERFNDALSLGVGSAHGDVIAKYYMSLKKQGYDAIPDENDIRLSTFKAQAPIIFFNTMDSIGSVKVKNLSAGEVFEAYTRTIGAKTARSLLLPGKIGNEKLTEDTKGKTEAATRQQQADRYSLNRKYTMTNLATDWGVNHLSNSQIRRVNRFMDEGKTYQEAVDATVSRGSKIVGSILSKI